MDIRRLPYFAALLLIGCAMAPQTTPTPDAAAQIPAECINADAEIQDACVYLLGAAQGRQNQAPLLELTDKSRFPSADPDVIKRAPPAGNGDAAGDAADLVRAEILVDTAVAHTVKQYGIPDAVELANSRAFAMYYRTPSHAFIFDQGRLITLTDIPGSTRVLMFKQRIASARWPVTLTGEAGDLLEVPQAPPPPIKIGATGYADDDRHIRAQLPTGADSAVQTRAAAMLERLAAAAQVEGIDWQMVVFKSSDPDAFAVPDGTLFMSDGLVKGIGDSELAAVIAHLMGHVGYGHYQKEYQGAVASETESMTHPQAFSEPFSAATCLTRMVGSELLSPVFGLYLDGHSNTGVPLFTFLAPVAAPVVIAAKHRRLCNPNLGFGEAWSNDDPPKADGRREEWEANYIGADYLLRAGIGPDALFDAMAKLTLISGSDYVAPPEKTGLDYVLMQDHGDNGAADFGRMLDAGIIPGQ
jgi:hypothetical protein